MIEAALLHAVQWDVGVVEIEHDLARRAVMRFEEDIDQQRIDLRSVAINLVVLRGIVLRRVLKTVERALARQCLAVRAQHRGQLPGQRRERRVLAQFVVVVEVLVAQCQAEDPLADQRLDLMLHIARVTPVAETLREPTDQPKATIHLAQQQAARVRGDVAAIEASHHCAAADRFKFILLRATLCRHRGSPSGLRKSFSQNHFPRFAAPMHCLRLRNPG